MLSSPSDPTPSAAFRPCVARRLARRSRSASAPRVDKSSILIRMSGRRSADDGALDHGAGQRPPRWPTRRLDQITENMVFTDKGLGEEIVARLTPEEARGRTFAGSRAIWPDGGRGGTMGALEARAGWARPNVGRSPAARSGAARSTRSGEGADRGAPAPGRGRVSQSLVVRRPTSNRRSAKSFVSKACRSILARYTR